MRIVKVITRPSQDGDGMEYRVINMPDRNQSRWCRSTKLGKKLSDGIALVMLSTIKAGDVCGGGRRVGDNEFDVFIR